MPGRPCGQASTPHPLALALALDGEHQVYPELLIGLPGAGPPSPAGPRLQGPRRSRLAFSPQEWEAFAGRMKAS